MAESKLGDIFILKKRGTMRAILRSVDGTPDVLLAAMPAKVYEAHPAVRELFTSLCGAVALNFDQPAGTTRLVQLVPPVPPAEQKIDRSGFPCWTCEHPQSAAARQQISSLSDADLQTQLTPRGNFIGCCIVQSAGSLARRG
jgi:hypothetical protein